MMKTSLFLFSVVFNSLNNDSFCAEKEPLLTTRPPVMDREYVLIENGRNIADSGCLAMALDGTPCWIEDHSVVTTYEDYGYSGIWDLNNQAIANGGRYLVISEDKKFITIEKHDPRFIYMYSNKEGGQGTTGIVIHDSKANSKYTITIDIDYKEIKSKKDSTKFIHVHSISVIDGTAGAEFKFSGMSK